MFKDIQGSNLIFCFFCLGFFFFPSFLPVFFATDVLCFCNCLCCMRREELAMQCFRLTQKKIITHLSVNVYACERVVSL